MGARKSTQDLLGIEAEHIAEAGGVRPLWLNASCERCAVAGAGAGAAGLLGRSPAPVVVRVDGPGPRQTDATIPANR